MLPVSTQEVPDQVVEGQPLPDVETEARRIGQAAEDEEHHPGRRNAGAKRAEGSTMHQPMPRSASR